jgi:HEAT repeat protein
MKLFGPPNIEKLKENQNIEGLLKALSNKKYADVRWKSAKALGQIRDKRAVESLIEALSDDHEYVRKCSTEALGEIGDDRALDKLVAALNDEDVEIRTSAANALGKIGNKRAIEKLIASLKDKDTNVQINAANALGKIGDHRAIKPLVDILHHQNQVVRENSSNALEKLGWQPANKLEEALKWIANRQWDMCIEIGASAVEPLISVLKDKDAGVRKSAVGVLGKIGDVNAIEALISAFTDHNEIVRRSAVDALAKIGGDLAIKELITAQKSNNEQTRRNAVYTLNTIGEDQASEALIEILKDHRKEVKIEVVSEIARLGLRKVKILVELVNKLADDIEEVRLGTANTFWKLKNVGFAIRSLRDEYLNQVHIKKEKVFFALISLKESADYYSDFEKLLTENWPNCQVSILEYIENLQNLKIKISNLPIKHPAGNIPSDIHSILSRLSEDQLKSSFTLIPLICKKISEAKMFLEIFFDSSFVSLENILLKNEKNILEKDLKVIIETTRTRDFIVLMFAVLNSDGIEILKNCINELEQLSNRIFNIKIND